MIIKILLIVGIALAGIIALRGSNSSAHLAIRRLLGVLFVFIAAVSVVFPNVVTWLANRLGVSTGSNLVLYALVVAFLFVTIGLNQRIHVLEDKLIRLSRQVALMTHAQADEQVCDILVDSGTARTEPECDDADERPQATTAAGVRD